MRQRRNLANEGKIQIASGSPLVYIETKIIVDFYGEQLTYYGKGCVCGALSFEMDGSYKVTRIFSGILQ